MDYNRYVEVSAGLHPDVMVSLVVLQGGDRVHHDVCGC